MMRSTKYLVIAGHGKSEQRVERLDKASAMKVVNEAIADGQEVTLCKIVSEIVQMFKPKEQPR